MTIQNSDDLMDIVIFNGNVVLPDDGVYNLNVNIKGGKIHSLTENILPAKEVINATHKYITPGVIDPHTHLGLHTPFMTDVRTETRAALLGGTTTIGTFFGSPSTHLETFPKVQENLNTYSYVDVIPHLVIRTDEQCNQISEYVGKFGVTSFKIYMTGVPGIVPSMDDGFIFKVMDELKKQDKNCILCSHTENSHMVDYAMAKVKREKGDSATILDWTETHPIEAEVEAVRRIAYFAELNKVPVYIVHLTSAEAVQLLSEIRLTNKYINVETTSPYLSITRNHPQGNALKMIPPFRDQKDLDGLWQGIAEGVIDTIGTDNVTTTATEKNLVGKNIWEVGTGYAAVEHHLTVAMHEGVIQRGIPIERVIACMTKNPAEKFGVYPRKGALLPGSDADVIIIDLELEKEVKANETASVSDFSIYEGRKFRGWPVATIKGGVLVAKDGAIIDESPKGKCIAR